MTYQKSSTGIVTHLNRIENFMGIDLGPYQKKTFWYHETMVTNPHATKSKIDQF
jgi:hypothetical protein